MKLATSTGDFSWYTGSVAEEIRSFKDSKFRYINLEQPGSLPAYFAESDDDWKRLADEWGNAAADAGVTFVVSHAPCLRMKKPISSIFVRFAVPLKFVMF